jgi:hypothetical protein
MKHFFKSLVLAVAVALATGVAPMATNSLLACPGCKNANETDSLRPRAYMYSILFMLAMPATVFAGFGLAFYRLSKRAELEQLQALQAEMQSTETPHEELPG